MIKPNTISLLAITLFLATASHLPARTWTDAATKRTLEGDYITADTTHVVIKSGGKPIKIAIARLSDADKAFIKQQMAKSSAPPVKGTDLESRMLGYWIPDVEKTVDRFEDDYAGSPMKRAFLGKMIVEIKKGQYIPAFQGQAGQPKTYTVKSEDNTTNTINVSFKDGDGSFSLENGGQLIVKTKDVKMILNSISKEEFEKLSRGKTE